MEQVSAETIQVNHRAYKRERTQPQQKHDYASKMYALSVYAETMSVAEASRASSIPYTTIDSWIKEEGTDSTLESLRTALRSAIAHKCASAAAYAVDVIQDRLTNGDYKLNKDNELVRVPISGKDAGYLAAQMIDRHALLTGTSALHGKANQALALVADKLMDAIKLAKAPNKEAEQHTKAVDNAK